MVAHWLPLPRPARLAGHMMWGFLQMHAQKFNCLSKLAFDFLPDLATDNGTIDPAGKTAPRAQMPRAPTP